MTQTRTKNHHGVRPVVPPVSVQGTGRTPRAWAGNWERVLGVVMVLVALLMLVTADPSDAGTTGGHVAPCHLAAEAGC